MRLDWDDRAALDAIDKALAEGVLDAAEHILEHANRTVPIEEGTLGRSAFVAMASGEKVRTTGEPGSFGTQRVGQARPTNGNSQVAVVAYDTPYAVAQHELTNLRHDSGRRAKWLQLTLNERAPKIRAFIADRARKALR